MMRRFAAVGSLLLAALLPLRRIDAQAVAGLGDDALTVPQGMVRFRVGAIWSSFNERYGMGNANGALEPLGTDFNLDTVGVAQLRSLGPLQSSLRTLSGQSGFVISLGKTVMTMNDQITTIPVTIETGLASRLSIGMTVPIVKTHVNVFFQGNPNNTEGNVGINPATTSTGNAAKTADSAFAAQLVALATQVQTYCTSNPSAAECANGMAATAAAAVAFGGNLGQVYTTAAFVPVAGTAVQQAIDTRAAAYKAALNALATVAGGTAITESGVIGATMLNTNDFQTILSAPQYGFAAEPIQRMDRYHLGDIELNAKLLLIDPFHGDRAARMRPSGFNVRLAVGGMLRFPTGEPADPDNYASIGSGTHEWAIGARGYGDFLFGSHFWTSLVARYDFQIADDRIMRITATPRDIFAPLYTRATVHRQLGNLFELEATPRWALNDFFSVSAQYVYRHKPADQYTGTSYTVSNAFTGGQTVTVDPTTLDLETSLTEHRLGGGISFSNLHAVSQGKARIPLEVSFQHLQTTSGSGGNVPKQTIDQMQMRLYFRLFGH